MITFPALILGLLLYGQAEAALPRPTNTTITSVSTSSMWVQWKEKINGRVIYDVFAATNSTLNPIASSITLIDLNSLVDKTTQTAIANLTSNTRYWVSVRAGRLLCLENEKNCDPAILSSDFSAPDNEFTLAAPPSGLLAQNLSHDKVLLSWNSGNNPAGTLYEVGASTDYFQVHFSTPISFASRFTLNIATISSLEPNTSYQFRVRSRNSDLPAVLTPFSDITQARTGLAPAPAVPTLTRTIEASTGALIVTWKEKNNGPIEYLISASLDQTEIAGTIVSTASFSDLESDVNKIATATVQGLNPNTLYWVSIRAQRENSKTSAFSSADSISTLANMTLPEFFGVNRTSITVNWIKPEGGAEGFKLEISTSPALEPILGSRLAAGQTDSLTITGLDAAATYFIRLGSLNLSAVAHWSPTISTVTLPKPEASSAESAPLLKPTLTKVLEASADSLTVSWKEKNDGTLLFKLAAATDSSNIASTTFTELLIPETDGRSDKITTATLTGLIPNTIYWVWVAVSKNNGIKFSDHSAPDKGLTLARAPSGLKVRQDLRSSYLLEFSDNGNPTDTPYEISRSLDNFETTGEILIPFSSHWSEPRTQLKNLIPGLAYYVRIRAQNREKTNSPYSETLKFTASLPAIASSSTIKRNAATILYDRTHTYRLSLRPLSMTGDAVLLISEDPLNEPLHITPHKLQSAINALGNTQILTETLREFSLIADNSLFLGDLPGTHVLEVSYAGQDKDQNGLLNRIEPSPRAEQLSLWVWDEGSPAFEPCPDSKVNISNQRVSCSPRHFSVYAVLIQSRKILGISEALAYPVPWRPNDNDPSNGDGSGITFANLPFAEGEITIFDLNGNRIHSFGLDGSSQMQWNGKNHHGANVASGLYIWRLGAWGGSKTGKLMIIR